MQQKVLSNSIDKDGSSEKYDKMTKMLAFKLRNSEEILEHGEKEGAQLEYDKVCEYIRKMEMEIEELMKAVQDGEKTLGKLLTWGKVSGGGIKNRAGYAKESQEPTVLHC